MSDTYGPFDAATGDPRQWTQDQWYRHAPKWAPSGVNGVPAASTTTGDLALTLSGLTPSIGSGRAWVRGAGFERTAGAAMSAIPANTNVSQSRRDRIVLRRDLSAKTVGPVLIQGTPSSSPTDPAIQQVETGLWDLPLFSFLVPPNSGTTVSDVLDERGYLGDGTADPMFISVRARDGAIPSPTRGQRSVTTDSGLRWEYNGSAWTRPPVGDKVFTTLAARDSFFTGIAGPLAGDRCICLGTQMTHDGTKWRFTLSDHASGNCDANGFFSFPHGGGQIPVSWEIVPAYQATDALSTVISILNSNNVGDATVLGCRAVRTDTNTYLGVNPINVNWSARF